MCNAYSLSLPRQSILDIASGLAQQLDLELLDADGLPADLGVRFRYSPRQMAPILHLDDSGRLRWTMALWGFLTKGGKPGFAPTNARSDKLDGGWPWKMVSGTQRCLVPADGFFEPEKPAGDKSVVPWSYYALGNRQPFLMGGLFNFGPHPKSGDEVPSFTIVTTDANSVIRLHNRMPVMINDEQAGHWLEPGPIPQESTKPYPAARMTGWRVIDEARNSRIKDHEGMIEPVSQTSLFD